MSIAENPHHRKALDSGEFKRGWRVIVLGLFGVCTSISAALLYGFGTLVIPLQQAFGWSRGDLSAAITFLFAGVAISSQLVGWLYKRFGLRRVAIISVLLQVVGYWLMTLMQGSIGWLYLGFFLLPLVCVGTIAITWTQLVNLWFERNRGLALAIILCGTGLAAMNMPTLMSWVIGRWGWQAAFWLLGAIPLVFTLPMALVWLRLPAPSDDGQRAVIEGRAELAGMPFKQALRSRVFWGCNIALILSVSLIVGMVTNTVPMLQGKGLSAQTASQIFASFGMSIIVGRLTVGYLLDRYSPTLVAAVSLALPAIGCLIFLLSGTPSIALLIFATLTIGCSAGAEFDLAAFLMARFFGLRDYARIFGLHLGLVTVISGLMPIFFGHLYQTYGNYSPMLLYCLACAIVGPLIMLGLKRASVISAQPQHA